ncbi:hypothetical protein Aglo03_50530 [Actinokineospora globicatena]|uniref:Uncharacterized protein n=1 Tax=Actinokineospora globicatena TaxID=103729 RepID=A0A9W6QTD3_9PSEU|nr:hypothetical protein Aglo03_50530 [Actinokineospora globicatena]
MLEGPGERVVTGARVEVPLLVGRAVQEVAGEPKSEVRCPRGGSRTGAGLGFRAVALGRVDPVLPARAVSVRRRSPGHRHGAWTVAGFRSGREEAVVGGAGLFAQGGDGLGGVGGAVDG